MQGLQSALHSVKRFSCTTQDNNSTKKTLSGIASSLNHLHFDTGSATWAAPGEMCSGFFILLLSLILTAVLVLTDGMLQHTAAGLDHGDLSTD